MRLIGLAKMKELLDEIRHCKTCLPSLINGVNPVLKAHSESKIIIIGQAPGSVVHKTGKAWDDKSGERLREWLGVSDVEFYNEKLFALIPMGFCYPGKGKSGDLPPRPECAPQWHEKLLDKMHGVELTLLIGNYAQKYYLRNQVKPTLTETVRNYESYYPKYIPLPHPSPRNNIWLKKNEWFNESLLPMLKKKVQLIIH